jgi:hypothetical protein
MNFEGVTLLPPTGSLCLARFSIAAHTTCAAIMPLFASADNLKKPLK